MFVTTELPIRVFGEDGDCIDRTWIEFQALDGVTFNGHEIREDDFDNHGSFTG